MRAALLPDDETRRLERLRALAVLDTAPEPFFDSIVRIASLVTGSPIALVSLIDHDRQWFKAQVGLDGATETPRDISFCAHAIHGSTLFEVRDTHEDDRFADNPLVEADPNIRFYAGMPIAMQGGSGMGTLCVIDHVPRELTQTQREILTDLGGLVGMALEQRAKAGERSAALAREIALERDLRRTAQEWQARLRASESFLDRTGAVAGVGGFEVDLASNKVHWSAQTCRIHDMPAGYEPDLNETFSFFPESARETIRTAIERSIASGTGWDVELPMVTALHRSLWVRSVGEVEPRGGPAKRLIGAIQDTTDRHRAVASLEASERRFRQLFHYSLGLICTHDLDGILLSVNPAAAHSLGYPINGLMGRSLADFMRPEVVPAFHAYLRRIVDEGSDSGRMELRAANGDLRIWAYHNVLDDDDDERYVLGHAQDITEQHRQERQLREWSLSDPLTRCFNRRYLGQLGELTRDETLGCITVDLDHFKAINDTYGHQRGDDVLVDMATFLRARVRDEDAVVRLGGDEFLVVLRSADDRQLTEVIDRLRSEAKAAPISFTLGAAMKLAGTPLDAALSSADQRLYEARACRDVR
jgi:diguanylate cyclase (GGDEF)-like protein/PAS domain S-box-containing protein